MPAFARAGTLLLMLFSISGCASFGPTSVDRDRLDYIQAIATSWKQPLAEKDEKVSPPVVTIPAN
jgi:hypothetical protein